MTWYAVPPVTQPVYGTQQARDDNQWQVGCDVCGAVTGPLPPVTSEDRPTAALSTLPAGWISFEPHVVVAPEPAVVAWVILGKKIRHSCPAPTCEAALRLQPATGLGQGSFGTAERLLGIGKPP